MAQNELSGPMVWSLLAAVLQKNEKSLNLKRKYFFSMGPETIGAIALIDYFFKSDCRPNSCSVLTCLGSLSETYTIQEGRKKNSLIENIMYVSVRDRSHDERIKFDDFSRRGSDERQFDYPGVDFSCSYFSTKKYHQYAEYHSSKDDLQFISIDQIIKSTEMYLYAIFLLENNDRYVTTTYGEPKLSNYGLWPVENIGGRVPSSVNPLNLLVQFDGTNELIDIAINLNLNFIELLKMTKKFLENNLIKKI